MNIISNNAISADNQQETLEDYSYFYYSGFLSGEMSCSIIKFRNCHPAGYYFMPDVTVTNADIKLLRQVNHILTDNDGIISKVKGAFNLSFRGKKKVRKVLNFLDNYPILIGDLARNRIELMREAMQYLECNRGHKIHQEKTQVMKRYRHKLRMIKEKGCIFKKFPETNAKIEAIGYFLSGIIDSEGSIGMKKCGQYSRPFIAVAMKDEKIVRLFQKFLGFGNTRLRKDGAYHFETNSRNKVKTLANMFLQQYPLRHERQRKRLKNLQWILNDYTPNSFLQERIMI